MHDLISITLVISRVLHEKSDSSIGQIQCHLFGSFEDMKKSDVSNYWHLTLSILVVLDDGI